MAMLLVIQIALISFVVAQEPISENNFPNGWWFKVTPARNPPVTPCLLRSQPVTRRDDYTYTPGIGGHKIHTNARRWNDARQICEEEGGHLAIINSIAESKVIAELFAKSGPIVGGTGSTDYLSIGIHGLFQKSTFLTIHGQTIARAGFNQWQPGQPDNADEGEDCGSINKSGALNDIKCGKTYGFVCELPIY